MFFVLKCEFITMAFKYDVVTLLELIEMRPCLWDKNLDISKDKLLREKCWQEIFAFLETGYEEMSKDEKKKTGDIIVKKWANIRDSFMKSLRTKTGQAFQKKYIYADNLNFLLKVVEKAETESNLDQSESSSSGIQLSSSSTAPGTQEPAPLTPEPNDDDSPQPKLLKRQKKTKREPDEIEKAILAELKKNSQKENVPSRTDEKETILLSFLPYIKDMNENEMMDLNMEILTSIKKIKQKRSLKYRIIGKSSSSSSTVSRPTVQNTKKNVPAEFNENASPSIINSNINPESFTQLTAISNSNHSNAYQNLLNQFSAEIEEVDMAYR